MRRHNLDIDCRVDDAGAGDHRLHHRSLHRAADDQPHRSRHRRGAPSSGYLLGDLIGGDHDRNAKVIGAGIGALAGGAVGNYMDQQEAELRRQTAGTGVDVYPPGRRVGPADAVGHYLPGRSATTSSRNSSRPSTRSRRRWRATTRPISTCSATPIRPAATPITRPCRSGALSRFRDYLAGRGVARGPDRHARLWRKPADRVRTIPTPGGPKTAASRSRSSR